MGTQADNIQALIVELANPKLNAIQRAGLQQELARQQSDPQRDTNISSGLDTVSEDASKGKVSYKQAVQASVNAGEMPGKNRPMADVKAPSVTTKAYDQNYIDTQAGLSNSMLDILNSTIGQNKELYSQLSSARKDQESAILEGQKTAEAGIKQSAAEAVTKNQEREQTLAQYGIANPTSADYVAFVESASKRSQLAQEIAANEGINPLTNPLGYLAGQFKNMWLTQQHNTQTNIANSSMETLQQKQRVASSTLSLQPDLTAAQIAEREKVKLMEATVKAETALADLKSQGVRDGLSQNTNLMSMSIQGYKIQKDEAIAARQLGITKDAQDRAYAKDPRKAAIEEAQWQDLEKTAANYQTLTGQQISPVEVATKVKDPRVEIVRQWQTTGFLGEGPFDSIENIVSLGGGARSSNPEVYQAGKRAARWKEKAADMVILVPDKNHPGKQVPKVAKTDKEAEALDREKLISAVIADKDAVAKDASTTSPDNPFVAREGNAILEPALQRNIVTQALHEANKNGLGSSGWTNAQTIKLMSAKVITGEVSERDAAVAISNFYATTLRSQSKAFGLDLLRIPPPTEYRLKDVLNAKGLTLFGNIKTRPSINLLDPAEVEAALVDHKISFVAQKRMQDASMNMGSGGFEAVGSNSLLK